MLRLENVLSDSDKKRIYQSAITLLEKVGFLCNHAECLEYFREAGCKIGEELDKPKKARKVLFTEEIVTDALRKAPSEFTIYPTSPGYKEMTFPKREIYFCNEGGDYVRDFRTDELRPCETRDLVEASQLIDACDNVDTMGPAIYWLYDLVPVEQYERYGLWDIFMSIECLHNGKPKCEVYSTATLTEVPTLLRTWQICAGGEKAFREKPCGTFFVAPVSPYYLPGRVETDDPWSHGDSLLLMTKAGVPINIEPCGLLGLSGPVTVAGLLAQCIAEFLGMNVAVQAINPGNPVMLNDYTGSVDMFTGGKHEARPEANLVHLGLTAMAHYLNVPISTVNCTGSVEADAQMGWENMAVFLSQYLAGTDMIGSIGGLSVDDVFDPQALLMGNEMVGWIKHFAKGIDMDEDAIPLDLMMELGTGPSGGNFLGTDHTKRLYKTKLWQPSKLTNNLSRDAWVEAGQVSITDRTREMAEDILAKHEPKVPESQQKELRDFISEILDREGIKGDEAKKIMDMTYWQR